MTASTSNDSSRILTIDIEQNGRIITTLKVNDGSTVGNCSSLLKMLISYIYHVNAYKSLTRVEIHFLM